MNFLSQNLEEPIKGDIYSIERLEEYAAFLASELKVVYKTKTTQFLLPRMRDNGKQLLRVYRALTKAIHRKETIPPAAEWLTDNFHIVEDQIRKIQEDLPPAFYKELPKLSVGSLAGYPRIYAIALALVAHTDSHLEPDTIRRFVRSYQTISALNIGELWALAITLRLVLLENLRRIAIHTAEAHEKKNLANDFADRLFDAAGDKIKFHALINELPKAANSQDNCAYLAQIAKRLRDQEPELWPALEYLEELLLEDNCSTEQIVHLSHHIQASNQITVANIITSMRLLSSLNWREFFESVSLVDRVLEKDAYYKKMDFLTRDRYRHIIERVGKKTGFSEIEISEKVVAMASDTLANYADAKRSHIGYFLIDRGFKDLEDQFD